MAIKFTNSELVDYVKISPYKNADRIDENGVQHSIKKLTWHHTACVVSVERLGEIMSKPGRNMSATYGIGSDARIGRYLDEKDRPWTSSSRSNDFDAVTLEISNSSSGGDWPISDAVMAKAIELSVDICKRNGIEKLTYTGDATGNFTFHKMFAATACLPVDRTEVLTPTGWVLLKDIKIGDVIATVHVDNLKINFSKVLNKVPEKLQDTYTIRDFEGTSDHRVMFYNQSGRQYVGQFKDLFDKKGSIYLPNAGYFDGTGVEVDVDKEFSWDLINMTRDQAAAFLTDICGDSKNYSSNIVKNIDIVQAIATLNGIGSKVSEDGKRIYFKNAMRPLGDNTRKRKRKQLVSCVTVESGFILIRQHGRTTITGNCPGPYIESRANEIVAKINAKLAASTPTDESKNNTTTDDNTTTNSNNTTTTTSATTFNVGDLVSITSSATYYTGGTIPSWVKNCKWYISSIKGDRAVLGKSSDGKYNIESPINTKYLNKVSTSTSSTTTTFKSYTVTLKATDIIYKDPTNSKTTTSKVGKDGVYTIVEEKTVNNVKYGKLKSGAGWVKLDSTSSSTTTTTTSSTIKKGDKVKVVNAIQYDNGKSFKVYASSYTVLEVKGDRVVISSDGKNVTAAVSSKNLKKL